MTDKTMTEKVQDKERSMKHYTENQRFGKTNPVGVNAGTPVWKGSPFSNSSTHHLLMLTVP
jgi:hypothetical protein